MSLKLYLSVLFTYLFFYAEAQENKLKILEQKVDSLEIALDSCQSSFMHPSDSKIVFKRIQGKFVSASQGDCFHLLFKDSAGNEWDFGSSKNSIPYELWEYHDDSGEFSLANKVIGKEFILVIADLYSILCNSAESYDEGHRQYIKMPTILELTEIKK